MADPGLFHRSHCGKHQVTPSRANCRASSSQVFVDRGAPLLKFDLKAKRDEVIIMTDEVDVSALLKLLLDRGAKVEVYSAHDYPEMGTGHG